MYSIPTGVEPEPSTNRANFNHVRYAEDIAYSMCTSNSLNIVTILLILSCVLFTDSYTVIVAEVLFDN